MHSFSKINPRGGFAFNIHKLKARQALRPWAKKHRLALHRKEVFAIDPDQIDRAIRVATSGFLVAHAFDGFHSVCKFDVF